MLLVPIEEIFLIFFFIIFFLSIYRTSAIQPLRKTDEYLPDICRCNEQTVCENVRKKIRSTRKRIKFRESLYNRDTAMLSHFLPSPPVRIDNREERRSPAISDVRKNILKRKIV